MRAQMRKDPSPVDKADPVATAIARGVNHLGGVLAKDTIPASGVAARALILAAARGYVPPAPLDPMIARLKQPAAWPETQRIPLAWALAAAERHGRAASTDLEVAAKLVRNTQEADGSYGTLLDTWRARFILIEAGAQPDEVWITMIDRWVRGAAPESIAEAASVLLALDLAGDVMAENLRRTCLGLLRPAQSAAGGWGAADSTSTVVETALSVMALAVLQAEPRMARSTYRPEELAGAIARGKAFLASAQHADGDWGSLDASGWALLALLAP